MLVGFSPRPCVHTHHVYTRTHRRSACGRHNASLRDGARCDARVRAAERLFLYARSSASRQLREAGSTHGRRARSRARRLSRQIEIVAGTAICRWTYLCIDGTTLGLCLTHRGGAMFGVARVEYTIVVLQSNSRDLSAQSVSPEKRLLGLLVKKDW